MRRPPSSAARLRSKSLPRRRADRPRVERMGSGAACRMAAEEAQTCGCGPVRSPSQRTPPSARPTGHGGHQDCCGIRRYAVLATVWQATRTGIGAGRAETLAADRGRGRSGRCSTFCMHGASQGRAVRTGRLPAPPDRGDARSRAPTGCPAPARSQPLSLPRGVPARQRQAGPQRGPVVVVDLDVDDADTGVGDVEDDVALDGRHGVGERDCPAGR